MIDETKKTENKDFLLGLSSEIVASYVGNSAVSVEELPGVITSVFNTLSTLGANDNIGVAERKPAVPVRKSYTDEYIICLEDGKKLKMLKRYIRTRFGMSPEEYRAKWGLPADYPMVAPNYAAKRSEFAKKIGLGKRGKDDFEAAE